MLGGAARSWPLPASRACRPEGTRGRLRRPTRALASLARHWCPLTRARHGLRLVAYSARDRHEPGRFFGSDLGTQECPGAFSKQLHGLVVRGAGPRAEQSASRASARPCPPPQAAPCHAGAAGVSVPMVGRRSSHGSALRQPDNENAPRMRDASGARKNGNRENVRVRRDSERLSASVNRRLLALLR